MKKTAEAKASQPRPISLKKNTNRVIIGTGLVATCAVYLLPLTADQIKGFVLAASIFYYLCSSLWLRHAKTSGKTTSHFRSICSFDAAVCSASLAYLCPNLILIGLFFCVFVFQAVAIGSIRQLLNDLACFLLGAAAIALLVEPEWSNQLDASLLLITIAWIAVYFFSYALFIQQCINKANQRTQQLYSEVVSQKVRGYKLARYVSPTVWNAVTQGKDSTLQTERKRVSVFFSDIEGFSSLSEEIEAETLTEILNTYLTEMSKIAAQHKGTIDKFMGDGLMVIFGDSESKGIKADCLRCVTMALKMRIKMRELSTTWYNQGIKKPLNIRMGINSGFCTVGSFGTSQYMDYTVLGTHVNLASRLESSAEPGEILISHETWSLIKDVIMCRDRGEIRVKGFTYPIKVYQVVDFRKNLGRNQSYFEEHSNGFSVHLDLERLERYERVGVAKKLENLADHLREQS